MFLAKSPFFIIKSPLSVGESFAKPRAALPHVEGHVVWRLKALQASWETAKRGHVTNTKFGVNSCSSQDLSSKAFCMNVLWSLLKWGIQANRKKRNKANEEVAIREYPQHVKIIQHGPLQPAFIHLTIGPGGDLNPTLESKKSIAVNLRSCFLVMVWLHTEM